MDGPALETAATVTHSGPTGRPLRRFSSRVLPVRPSVDRRARWATLGRGRRRGTVPERTPPRVLRVHVRARALNLGLGEVAGVRDFAEAFGEVGGHEFRMFVFVRKSASARRSSFASRLPFLQTKAESPKTSQKALGRVGSCGARRFTARANRGAGAHRADRSSTRARGERQRARDPDIAG